MQTGVIRRIVLSFMQIVGCTEVDVMTVPGMDKNILATSDQPGVDNVIPRRGMQPPDFWSPSDRMPVLKVVLPEVYGVPPEEYDVMTIKITAQKFDSVTVTVVNSDDQYVFSVSIFSFIEVLSI